jgi:UrcA family protein
MKSPLRIALFASVIGFAFAAAPASAQDEESITVTAPHFRNEPMRLNGPLESVSLSGQVRYDDLDLRSWRGARELKMRVRDEAQDICTRIAEAYPVREAPGTSCYKSALKDGLIHADEAISDARSYGYDRYYARYGD